jgi:N-6 DNA Methylase
LTPEEFIAKWRGATRTERSAAQEHFLSLCELLGVPKPGDVDRHGMEYTFEKSVLKLGGTAGYADVWKRGCFAWEYKGPKKNLVQAYAQLKQYADALENPPLLIVSDMQEIRIHTNFTNAITKQHSIALIDLIGPEPRRLLRDCFVAPERLRPTATRESVTAEAAIALGAIAARFRAQGLEPGRVAHFLNKLVFCLFSEDIDLLPNRLFAEIVEEASHQTDDFEPMLRELFEAMAKGGKRFGTAAVPWFNGGLFNDADVLNLGFLGIADLAAVARLDWSAIEPSIFGTLFERGLDPATRREMAMLFDADARHSPQTALFSFARAENRAGVGIHYTDPQTIAKLIEPIVLRPLISGWNQLKGMAAAIGPRNAEREYLSFREKLGAFRVLDPACGSGNFLAISLSALKDFDLRVRQEAAAIGLPNDQPRIGPQSVLGIEVDAYAAELARLTVWIAELQWEIRNGFRINRIPILGALDGIMRRDALVNPDHSRAEWPTADVVIGNPPFVGGKLMRTRLTSGYVDRLFSAYAGMVPAEADLVTYWFAQAWEGIKNGRHKRAGLVATNSIRGGASRRVLDRIVREGVIFDTWDDEPWVIDGAAVRVSLVCFAKELPQESVRLDGRPVQRINSDLSEAIDLTAAHRLRENHGVAFMGDTKGGAFDIPGALARRWLELPLNPNGRPNSDVLRPWMNGMDLARRPSDHWIIDFGLEMSETAAAMYEAPFQFAHKTIRPDRVARQSHGYAKAWWRHERPRPEMWRSLEPLQRFIATPTVSKHRLFSWITRAVCPDHQLIVIARDDDTSFGILHSRFHEAWALRLCTWLGVGNDPRYTPSTTFETFPFPEGMTPNLPSTLYQKATLADAIASAARQLSELRNNWLYPADFIDRIPEIKPGYPERIVAKSAKAAAELKGRTLTNLYNRRPAWLDNAHRDLDAAVADAYGWPSTISEDQAVAQLLELNQERYAAQAHA